MNRPRNVTASKFDVFGRLVIVTRDGSRWKVFYGGIDGKRRPATDIVIPPDVDETQLKQYLSDLCHEWATTTHPEVVRL
ncbi:MAG: hypothetical protein QNJ40_08910 [Xanthomonadales bacterium]|nr:hypothetical protein [Xanthomonadales bacterium]